MDNAYKVESSADVRERIIIRRIQSDDQDIYGYKWLGRFDKDGLASLKINLELVDH